MPPDLVVLASVRRPWGRRGELLLELHTDWPEQRFARGTRCLLRWTDGRTRELTVAGFREAGPGALILFEGIEGIGPAAELAGAELVAPRESLAPVEPDALHHVDLIGLAVWTADGRRIGQVVAVDEGAACDYVRVRLEDSSEPREELIPLASAICPEIDLARGRLVVDPPEGLLDPERAETIGQGGRTPPLRR